MSNKHNDTSTLTNFRNSGIKVILRDNSSKEFEKQLRIFNQKVSKEGILKDLKKHDYFVSKGTKKRLRKKEAIKRQHIAIKQKDNMNEY